MTYTLDSFSDDGQSILADESTTTATTSTTSSSSAASDELSSLPYFNLPTPTPTHNRNKNHSFHNNNNTPTNYNNNNIHHQDHNHSRRKRQHPAKHNSKRTTSSGTAGAITGCFSCGADPSLVLEPHVLQPNLVDDHVVIIGCGAIGGFVGLSLYQSMPQTSKLTFLVRNAGLIERYSKLGFAAHCITTSKDSRAYLRSTMHIPAKDVPRVFTTNVKVLKEASCILVATPRTANATSIHPMLCLQQVSCPVVFLQCGMNIHKDLLLSASDTTVAGNLIETKYQVVEAVVGPRMRVECNAQRGILTVQHDPLEESLLVLDGGNHRRNPHQREAAQAVANLFDDSIMVVHVSEEKEKFVSYQAAQLQWSMMEAINALSGLTVANMLHDAGYRRVLAHCMEEVRAVFAAQRIPLLQAAAAAAAGGNTRQKLNLLSSSSPWSLQLFPSLLKSWNMVFLSALGSNRMESLDCHYNMARDLMQRKGPSELEYINGAVVRLGKLCGVPTPVNAKVVDLMQRAQAMNLGSPKLSSKCLLREVELEYNNRVPLIVSNRGEGGPNELSMLMSFDSLRGAITSSVSSSSGYTVDDSCSGIERPAMHTIQENVSDDDSSVVSIQDRVQSMLVITALSSGDLTFLPEPPASPDSLPSTVGVLDGTAGGRRPAESSSKTAIIPSLEPSATELADIFTSFDRSVRLWN